MYFAAAIIFCKALRSFSESREMSAVSTVGEKRRIFACRATTSAGGCCSASDGVRRGFLVWATSADTSTENTSAINRLCFNNFIENPSHDLVLHKRAFALTFKSMTNGKWKMIYGKWFSYLPAPSREAATKCRPLQLLPVLQNLHKRAGAQLVGRQTRKL